MVFFLYVASTPAPALLLNTGQTFRGFLVNSFLPASSYPGEHFCCLALKLLPSLPSSELPRGAGTSSCRGSDVCSTTINYSAVLPRLRNRHCESLLPRAGHSPGVAPAWMPPRLQASASLGLGAVQSSRSVFQCLDIRCLVGAWTSGASLVLSL